MENKKISGNLFDIKVLIRLFKFMMPYASKFYLLLFLTISVALLGPIRPYLIQKALDQYVANGNAKGLLIITVIISGILVTQVIFTYIHTYLSGWLGQHLIRDIRVKLYKHLVSLRIKFFDNTPIGQLVTRNVSDIETLAEVFSQGFAAMLADLLQIFFILGLMLYTDWKLTLVSLSTLPILIFCTYVFKEKIKVVFNNVRNAVSKLNTFVQEHITGMKIVQIFNSENREQTKFQNINKQHRDANIKSVLYYSIYFPVAEVIGASATGLLVWYGAQGVISESISVGVLISFIMYISMFFRPIRLIGDRFNTLQMGVVSSSRIFKLLDSSENIPDEGEIKSQHINGEIEFNNVSFAYKDDQYVLKNISFHVPAGQTLALVGATGAGKSSIINLLNRFYDIQDGEINVDRTNIKNYSLECLRENIGVVLQDIFLFSGSILDNITLGNSKISFEQVVKASKLVGAHSFIEQLPGQYNYEVMERGSTLSVGQRQLISFVRVLVYDPKIIVLDEATSSVDSHTEEMIQNAIAQLMSGRTAIVIAHRLATIQQADNILVLDKGEIKEAGNHSQLLAQDGHYKKLHEMQYKEKVRD
ncbi:ABC transporter ATP-binding protein [Aureibacter tunicatorum]|uniref:ATP-binding cassette subfamily B protein n=1 Tax=Aureibacter tunicatorum TaxID=866807 RepID=A0AAE3XLU8_9BACT|nr:ABC transporter ATP-binding protein [Aureibacter tunicatorum]MDR6238388.1 ATP-binding cassette subfamily B protein [Aureibacter tunicatorum]BDD03420.1 xenobiotic ABC transporter ATP-binding protein [Aureibacter tunicatorum]